MFHEMKLTIETKEDALDTLRALTDYVVGKHSNPPSNGTGASAQDTAARTVGAPSEIAPLIVQAIKDGQKPLSGGELADVLAPRFPKEARKALYTKIYSAAAYMVKKERLAKNDDGKFKLL